MENEAKEENKDVKDQVLAGDLVKVEVKVREAGKERAQTFEGTVLAVKGRGASKSFTVRRIASGGVGVERIWPFTSPSIKSIKIIKKRPQKRAKIFYIRKLKGREATGAYL